MTTDFLLHVGVAAWWSFAVVVLALARDELRGAEGRLWVVAAVFWPVFVVLALPVLLWRVPFRTVKQMKADIRNRGQWNEFQHWVNARRKKDSGAEGGL